MVSGTNFSSVLGMREWSLIPGLVLLLASRYSQGLQVYKECQKEGQIAFTFDQGPSQYTGILLTSLLKANVKATFHVVPDYLDNPVLSANLRRASTEGHLIGIFVKESITEGSVKAYLANATSIIKQYINYQPQFLRFPVPGPNEAMLKVVTGLGYRVSSYNLDSQDYGFVGDTTDNNGEGNVYRTIRGVLDQIVPPTLGSFICVQRDIVQASVMQMPAILNYTKSRKYKPVKLDECIGVGTSIPRDSYNGGDDAASGGNNNNDNGGGLMGHPGGVTGQAKNQANRDQNFSSYSLVALTFQLLLIIFL